MNWSIQPLTAFEDIAPHWQRLHREHCGQHPALDLKFIRPLLEFFADGSQRLAVLEDESGVAAILIVEPDRFGIWKTFTPDQAVLTPMVARSLATVFDALPTLFSKLSAVCWQFSILRCDPASSGGLPDAGIAREALPYARTISVSLEGDFNSYWEERKKKLRDNVARYFRRMEKEALASRLEAITAPGDIAAAVKTYGKLESAGWKGRQGTAIGPDNVQGRFYTAVLSNFADEDGAVVFHFHCAEQVVSSRIAIHQNGMVVFLKTTYDEAYSRYAVGRLQLHDAIRWFFQRENCRIIEFYTDAGSDQLQWATADREICHLNTFRSPAIMRGLHKLRSLRRSRD